LHAFLASSRFWSKTPGTSRRLRCNRSTYPIDVAHKFSSFFCFDEIHIVTYLLFASNSRNRIRSFFCWSLLTNKMQATNVAVFTTYKTIPTMTGFDSLFPSLFLPFRTRKVVKNDIIPVLISLPSLWIARIALTFPKSTSFSCNHYKYNRNISTFTTRLSY